MRAMIALIVTLSTLFAWSAWSAAAHTEAAWKAHDARLAAAIQQAEGN